MALVSFIVFAVVALGAYFFLKGNDNQLTRIEDITTKIEQAKVQAKVEAAQAEEARAKAKQDSIDHVLATQPNTENHSIPKSEIPATIEEFAVDSCAQDSVPAPLW